MNTALLRAGRVVGAMVAYGGLAAFLCLVGLQIYRWFRHGEWTHVGVSDGLRAVLAACCVKDGGGPAAALVHWIDAPVDWLGLHKLLDVLPASIALFALSVLGNSLFLYCCDRIDAVEQAT